MCRSRIPVMLVFCWAALAAAAVSPAAAPAPPTADEIRETVEAGDYRGALKAIAKALSAKGAAAAEGSDRYALFMLKGECLVRLGSNVYAADAFDDAREVAAQNRERAAEAKASELVVRRAKKSNYVPTTGADRSPIDVVSGASRKKA